MPLNLTNWAFNKQKGCRLLRPSLRLEVRNLSSLLQQPGGDGEGRGRGGGGRHSVSLSGWLLNNGRRGEDFVWVLLMPDYVELRVSSLLWVEPADRSSTANREPPIYLLDATAGGSMFPCSPLTFSSCAHVSFKKNAVSYSEILHT